MVVPEKAEFLVFLFDKISYSEASCYSMELEIIVPGKEARHGQS